MGCKHECERHIWTDANYRIKSFGYAESHHECTEDMFVYASNSDVSRFVTWEALRSLCDTRDFIQLVLQNYEDKKITPWGIQSKESGKLIGTIDFVSWQVDHHRAEIGYVLAPEY